MQILRTSLIIIISLLTVLLAGCKQHSKNEPEPEPQPVNPDGVTIVYAINKSSLSGNFMQDTAEMKAAMVSVDMSRQRLLVYLTESASKTTLYELQQIGKKKVLTWRKVKEYDRQQTSTAPAVMKQVISDALSVYPDAEHTLVFWGHGSAWTPGFSDHETRADAPAQYSYGGEYGKNNEWQWTEITDIANAIPDGVFRTIWFDCCYMSSIEVAYQLRNKTKMYVAYPTEVWDEGLNYNDVLPHIMRKNQDLTGAAAKFYSYYNDKNDAVTVSVMDMSKIEAVAEATRALMQQNPDEIGKVTGVSNYRRGGTYGYYDMMQLLKLKDQGDLWQSVQDSMNRFVIYHAESSKDFNNSQWVQTPLCGVSMHSLGEYGQKEADHEPFYRTLDWYKAVYEQ
jgi:hypothetical protein